MQLEAAATANHETIDKHVSIRHEQEKLKKWDAEYVIVSLSEPVLFTFSFDDLTV